MAIILARVERGCCPGCFQLGRVPDPDIQCEECGLVSYCSWACRAQDPLHQWECAVLARAGRVPARDETRVMVRALGRLAVEGGAGDAVPGITELRTFQHLLSHKDQFLASKQKTEDIKVVYEEVQEFLLDETPKFDEFVEVLGRLYINGFEICDDKMESYGWGVYLGPSVLDHSCQPSCTVRFQGRRLTVTAVKALSGLDQATISYLDPSLPQPVRQAKLRDNYYFQCACPKCVQSRAARRPRGGRR